MVRISGVDLPNNKKLEVGLTYIYGIGSSLSKVILQITKIDSSRKVKDLTEPEVIAIRDAIKEFSVEGELKKDIDISIKRLMEIGTYRGTRHRKGLPCRGQRTKTNGRTRRGKRRTVGLGRQKADEKGVGK